jgi:hypothetical protein
MPYAYLFPLQVQARAAGVLYVLRGEMSLGTLTIGVCCVAVSVSQLRDGTCPRRYAFRPAQLCRSLVDVLLVWIRRKRFLYGIEKHSKFLITEFSKSAIRSHDTNGVQPPCGSSRRAVARWSN